MADKSPGLWGTIVNTFEGMIAGWNGASALGGGTMSKVLGAGAGATAGFSGMLDHDTLQTLTIGLVAANMLEGVGLSKKWAIGIGLAAAFIGEELMGAKPFGNLLSSLKGGLGGATPAPAT